jgi:hypothetical protein
VDVADADLACQQQAENAEAGCIVKGLEHVFHLDDLHCHISVLTNMSAGVSRYIRFCRCKEPGMSDIQQAVRDKYGAIASAVSNRFSNTGCCGPTSCGCGGPITSTGFGNPTALLALQPGEIVLDLGSGGGIDVLLSAKRVQPTGKAYGLELCHQPVERQGRGDA